MILFFMRVLRRKPFSKEHVLSLYKQKMLQCSCYKKWNLLIIICRQIPTWRYCAFGRQLDRSKVLTAIRSVTPVIHDGCRKHMLLFRRNSLSRKSSNKIKNSEHISILLPSLFTFTIPLISFDLFQISVLEDL